MQHTGQCSRDEDDESTMARSRGVLSAAVGDGDDKYLQYRCLVCHETMAFRNVPDKRLVEHLHHHCPAVTPAVRSRLPRPNRPPSEAAAHKRTRRRQHLGVHDSANVRVGKEERNLIQLMTMRGYGNLLLMICLSPIARLVYC